MEQWAFCWLQLDSGFTMFLVYGDVYDMDVEFMSISKLCSYFMSMVLALTNFKA